TISGGTLTNALGGTISIGTTGVGGTTAKVTIESENSGTATGSFNNAGTLTVNSGSTLTLTNEYGLQSASGSITVASGGTLKLTGSDTISGSQLSSQSLIIDGGELVIAAAASAIFSNLIVDDDTTSLVNPGIDVSGTLTLSGGTEIWGGATVS